MGKINLIGMETGRKGLGEERTRLLSIEEELETIYRQYSPDSMEPSEEAERVRISLDRLHRIIHNLSLMEMTIESAEQAYLRAEDQVRDIFNQDLELQEKSPLGITSLAKLEAYADIMPFGQGQTK